MHLSLLPPWSACAILLAATGCHAPLSLPGGVFQRPTESAPRATSAGKESPSPRVGSSVELPAPEPAEVTPQLPLDKTLPPNTTDADLAGVLDKLQQVGQMDPTAQEKLIDQLRTTDPKFWPAVAEQFRASLAYHQELKSRSAQGSRGDDELSRAADAWPSSKPDPRRIPVTADGAPLPPAGATQPPSSPIGMLPDPRRVEVDGISVEALARSSPYAAKLPPEELPRETVAPRAPAPFAAETAAYPITEAGREPRQEPRPEPEQSTVRPVAYTREALAPTRESVQENNADDWQALVVEAANALEERVAPSPASTAEVHQHVSLRMLRLLAGETEAALEPIPHISPAEQDYWSRQMFALATYLDHHSQPDAKRRAAASVTHLDEAVANLREVGVLALRNLSFCKSIYGYGAIEPYPEDRFTPGQQVSLYVEVENYHSESTEKGFRTSLASTYEIVDDQGQRVDGGGFPVVDDSCRSRRRDFHIQFGLTLPKNMPAGRYRLELVVRDRQSDKIAHATAPFEVGVARIGDSVNR